MGTYAKFVVAAIGATLVGIQTALSDDVVTNQEWLTIAIAVLASFGVWAVPNAPVSHE
jgi:hypothetical protein